MTREGTHAGGRHDSPGRLGRAETAGCRDCHDRVHLRDTADAAVPRLDDRARRRRGWSRHGSVARYERHPEVGIWVSRHVGGAWTPPSRSPTACSRTARGIPTWNPVLFQPRGGPLMLFYKVGPVAERLVGHGHDVDRRRPDVVEAGAAARRHPGADQEQAGAARRAARSSSGSSTERRRLAGAHGAIDRRRADMAATPPLNDGKTIGAIQPTHPRAPGRHAPGHRPHAATTDLHDRVDRRRRALERDDADWTCRTPTPGSTPSRFEGRPVPARLQPHAQAGRRTAARSTSPSRATAGAWQAALVLEDERGTAGLLVSRGDPDVRRPGAHHLHVEAHAHPARRARSREAHTPADAGRRLAGV